MHHNLPMCISFVTLPHEEGSWPVLRCAVRNTVNTGRTVVCTIHQPSIDIFEVRLLHVQPCTKRCDMSHMHALQCHPYRNAHDLPVCEGSWSRTF